MSTTAYEAYRAIRERILSAAARRVLSALNDAMIEA